MRGVHGSSTERAARTLVVEILFRLGSIRIIVFVIAFVSVIELVFGPLARPGVLMARGGVILASYMSTMW